MKCTLICFQKFNMPLPWISVQLLLTKEIIATQSARTLVKHNFGEYDIFTVNTLKSRRRAGAFKSFLFRVDISNGRWDTGLESLPCEMHRGIWMTTRDSWNRPDPLLFLASSTVERKSAARVVCHWPTCISSLGQVGEKTHGARREWLSTENYGSLRTAISRQRKAISRGNERHLKEYDLTRFEGVGLDILFALHDGLLSREGDYTVDVTALIWVVVGLFW